MITVNKVIAQGRGLAPVLLKRAANVELDWDTRQKSRFDAVDSQGRTLGVFLPRGSVVRGGDVLVADDGSLVQVTATPQSVMVVRTCADHGSPFDLLRAAYHLGNRHVQLELRPDRLQLEPDHVLAGMLRQMHLIVSEETAPFEPESGAYAAGGSHGHGAHAHGHDDAHAAQPAHEHEHAHEHGARHNAQHGQAHGHGQRHDDAHEAAPATASPAALPRTIPIAAAAAPHVHGPDCDHGHDPGHDHAKGHDHGPDGHGHRR